MMKRTLDGVMPTHKKKDYVSHQEQLVFIEKSENRFGEKIIAFLKFAISAYFSSHDGSEIPQSLVILPFFCISNNSLSLLIQQKNSQKIILNISGFSAAQCVKPLMCLIKPH